MERLLRGGCGVSGLNVIRCRFQPAFCRRARRLRVNSLGKDTFGAEWTERGHTCGFDGFDPLYRKCSCSCTSREILRGCGTPKGGGISLHLRDSIDHDNAFLFHVFQAFMPFTPVSDLHPSKLKRDTTDDLTLLSGSCLIIQSSNAAISIPQHILK